MEVYVVSSSLPGLFKFRRVLLVNVVYVKVLILIANVICKNRFRKSIPLDHRKRQRLSKKFPCC